MSEIKKTIKSIVFILFGILIATSAFADIDKTWAVMKNGNPILLSANDADPMALQQLVFFSSEEQTNPSIKIKFENGSDLIYQKIIVDASNVKKEALSTASIKLKIKNDWLSAHTTNGSKIILTTLDGKYFDGTIALARKGTDYSYYSGSIKKIDSFAIATNTKVVASALTNLSEEKEENKENVSNSTHVANNVTVQTPKQPELPKESCTDEIKNQDESDVDCGGLCGKCINGKTCNSNDDCVTDFCTNKICETPVKPTPVQTQETAQENIPQKSAPGFDFSFVNKIKFDEQTKTYAVYGLLGIVALIVIIFLIMIIKKGSGRKKEPSVDELVKLYEEIKRL